MNSFAETSHPRDTIGRFAEKPQGSPEVSLASTPGTVVSSPVTGHRDANLWVQPPAGASIELNISEEGIGEPGQPYREDVLRLARDGDDIKAVFVVTDDESEVALREAIAERTPSEAEELVADARRRIALGSGGRADLIVTDDAIEVRHTARFTPDDAGGIYTANVMDTLESDLTYLYVRDGYFISAIYAAIEENE